MRDIIFFDFFGVISSEVAPVWFSKHFSEDEAKRLKAQIFTRADLGLISEEDTYNEMSALSGITPMQIKEDFAKLIKINTELVELIKSAHEHYAIYLLSNACSSFLRNILEKHNLYPLFDRVFISAELSLAKPNTDYFRYVIDTLGISAERCVMIDDNPKNTEAAESLGILGIPFVGNVELIQALKAEFTKLQKE